MYKEQIITILISFNRLNFLSQMLSGLFVGCSLFPTLSILKNYGVIRKLSQELSSIAFLSSDTDIHSIQFYILDKSLLLSVLDQLQFMGSIISICTLPLIAQTRAYTFNDGTRRNESSFSKLKTYFVIKELCTAYIIIS